MRPAMLLSAGGVWLLVSMASMTLAQSQHVTEAVQHAHAAVAQGKQGYPDALVTQAQESLKHAELEKKETQSSHLEEGIRMLKNAIDQGKQGHVEPATKAAEDALLHLSEIHRALAEPSQGDGY